MSQTRTPGVFTATHWTAVSADVVAYLDLILGTFKDQEKIELSLRAVVALQGFLASALCATRGGPMTNPEASINDLLLAEEVLRSARVPFRGHEEAAKLLEEYSEFLGQLARAGDPSTLPRETMVKVRVFLFELQHIGETRGYDQHMKRSDPLVADDHE